MADDDAETAETEGSADENDEPETEAERSQRIRSGVIVAVLFGALAASGSWMLPALYFQTTGINTHAEIQSSSVTLGPEEHDIAVTYDARAKTPVEVDIVLYRSMPNSSTDKTIQTWTTRGFLKEGEHTATFTLSQDEPLKPGTYYYSFRAILHLDYNIQRTLSYRTPAFTLNTSLAANSTGTETPTPTTPPPGESPDGSPTEPTATPTPTASPTEPPSPPPETDTEQPIGD